MAELQITVKTRTLERLIFIAIILALITYILINHFGDKTPDNSQETEEADIVEETALATCTDEIKNQDETNIDCGGACGGYWYSGTCNEQAEVVEVTNNEPDIECRLNSDCDGAMEKCVNNECVFSPECTTDNDCEANQECNNNECDDIQLSGDVNITIGAIEGSGTDFIKVEQVKLIITNGKAQTINYQFDAYIYYRATDYLADEPMSTNSIAIGQLAPGESVNKFFDINPKRGLSKTDSPYDKQWTMVLKFYDTDGNFITSLTKVFIPENIV